MTLTDQQIYSILESYGVSKKSLTQLEDTGHYFPKLASSSEAIAIHRDTQRFPHFSPAKDATPPHITSIRYIKDHEGGYKIFQRFHVHITEGRGGISKSEPKHDRFQAVNVDTGAIHAVGSTPRVEARAEKTLGELRGLTYTVGLQVKERGHNAVMSDAVMKRFNLR